MSNPYTNHQTVTSIDVPGKQIVLEGGKEFIHYDKLILAPGGSPNKLPIPGADLENVFTFRGVDDASKVDAGDVPPATPAWFTMSVDLPPSRQGRGKGRRSR